MELYDEVRKLYFKDSMSLRAIARRKEIHRSTVKKMIEHAAPPGYRRGKRPKEPVLGPFTRIIDQILDWDKAAPAKQRHTAQRIWERLKEEYEYPGGYTQVREYVARQRDKKKEAFIPLEFGPGEAQVDWGQAEVICEGERIKAHLFVMTLPFSNARFVACFPRETLEFFLEGHKRAFEFLGGVPRRITYDNLKAAVTKVGRGRKRDLNVTFEQFTEHYLYEPAFCNVAKGNEKGSVEKGVAWGRSKFFVPIPRFEDWGGFNKWLAQQCHGRLLEVSRGNERSALELLSEERERLYPIPASPARPKTHQTWSVSKLCLVRFDTNDYSTPCRYAYHDVTVRADVARVQVFHQESLIAEHKRCHWREKAIYEAWHYLPLIETKPRALDYGAPLKHLQLDDCFHVFRARLEDGQEHSEGTRAYIRVLRLLEEFSLAQLTRAVQRALALGAPCEEAVKHLALCPPERRPSPLDLTGRGHLAQFRFAPPDLTIYGALGQGGAQ